MRRLIQNNSRLPLPYDVRVEEFLNYFDYAYPRPAAGEIFKLYNDVTECPWNPANQLLRVGLQAPSFDTDTRPGANIVLLLDVSGSMSGSDRLPLLRSAMLEVVTHDLGPEDYVSIITYASGVSTVLPPTACTNLNKLEILSKIGSLTAGGGTNGSGGLQLAYQTAKQQLIPGGVNRILLGSDGDFNVGITSQSQLTQLVKTEAANGVTLTTLGFGIGNLNDSLMEALAANGNGNYHYVDTLNEAIKILVQESRSTFEVIAKDVKIRVEFDPTQVLKYRLIGYENRGLSDQEFEDDNVDAGELGLGDSVTALYEIVPAPNKALAPDIMAIVDVRYKPLDCERSKLMTTTVPNITRRPAPTDARFAAAVAEYAMLLRNSKYKGDATFASALQLAIEAKGDDPYGHRAEFVELVQRASILAK